MCLSHYTDSRNRYLMGSLVALSLTVEEKEEWVLSSNRKDSAAFAVSEGDTQVRLRTLKETKTSVAYCDLTFGLASVFQQVLVGNGEVASLEPPPLPVGPFSWVQLPGRRVR